jgi:hypothetical protein
MNAIAEVVAGAGMVVILTLNSAVFQGIAGLKKAAG